MGDTSSFKWSQAMPILGVLERLDGADLNPSAFTIACASAGWSSPHYDGVALWAATHPLADLPLILDTVTKPTTLLYLLDGHDDYEPEALLEGELRHRFDANFLEAEAGVRARFPELLESGTYDPPHNWRYSHFKGVNSRIALEQSFYDPVMGVQLLLLLQPLSSAASRIGPVSAKW